MASVDALVDLDSPTRLPSTYEDNSFDTPDVNSVALVDPFEVNYEVRLTCTLHL